MTEASPTREVSLNAEEGFREEQNKERGSNRLVLPEDGHGWKKYGQKFIKNIGKYRSYFKCQNTKCRAKKRAEWSRLDRSNLRVVYDGVHTHAVSTPESGSSQGTSTSRVNQYNLLTQVLGDQASQSSGS